MMTDAWSTWFNSWHGVIVGAVPGLLTGVIVALDASTWPKLIILLGCYTSAFIMAAWWSMLDVLLFEVIEHGNSEQG
jgi:hypothetical protein